MKFSIGRLWVHLFMERGSWRVDGVRLEPGWAWFWVGPLNVHYAVRGHAVD